jgi:hypothetical protein
MSSIVTARRAEKAISVSEIQKTKTDLEQIQNKTTTHQQKQQSQKPTWKPRVPHFCVGVNCLNLMYRFCTW